MTRSLIYGMLCGLLIASSAPAQDEKAAESADKALQEAKAELKKAQKAVEEASARAQELRQKELAKVREALKSSNVELPKDAMEAIEKALAAQGNGLNVVTVDASGLATVDREEADGKPSTYHFRKRVIVGPDGKVEVAEDGDPNALGVWLRRAGESTADDESEEKEVHVETRAFTLNSDGQLKGLAELPGSLRVQLMTQGAKPGTSVRLKKIEDGVLMQTELGNLLKFAPPAPPTPPAPPQSNSKVLAELKKLNERLDSIEERLGQLEAE